MEPAHVEPADLAAAYEQWADFYQWRLTRRAAELATDPSLRRILERDTDDLVYLFHRCAARARGEDPGPWLNSWERRQEIEHDYADADHAYANADHAYANAGHAYANA